MQVDDPDNPEVLERLVEALGATPVRHRNWYLCCGKACQTDEIPNPMMNDILSTINDQGADILGMICPTCFGQFDHGQKKVGKLYGKDFNTPPIYYFQLLAFAQGVPYDGLGFERHRFKPECLKRYEAAPPEGGPEPQAVTGA
jgi:heterodisulfide reductase subunit B